MNLGSPFIQMLQRQALETELLYLEDALLMLQSGSPPTGLINLQLSLVQDCCRQLRNKPLERTSVIKVSQLWHPLQQFENQTATGMLSSYLQRQHVLVANSIVWSWLHEQVMGHCGQFLTNTNRKPSEEQTWMESLADSIRTQLFLRQPSIHLQPSDFLPAEVLAQAKPYEKRQYNCHLYAEDDPHLVEDSLRILAEVLMLWLKFPNISMGYQGHFIAIMAHHMGLGITCLQATWHACRHFSKNVLQSASFRLGPETLSILDRVISHLPISNTGSAEKKILCQFTNVLDQFHLLIQRWNTTDNVPQVDMSNPEQVQQCLEAAIQRLYLMLRVLLPLIQSPTPSSETMNQIQQYVYTDTDKRLPFQEYGASRTRMRTQPSPFTQPYIYTHAGFFSALIYRFITFATPAAADVSKQVIFKTLKEWEAFVNRYNSNEYFNPHAYGNPVDGRGPTSLSHFWDTSSKWESFVKSYNHDTIPFQDFHQWISKLYLPSMGKLMRYLLTTDYVYAGVVELPTAQEMAKMISYLNTGALQLLQKLFVVSSFANFKNHEVANNGSKGKEKVKHH
ncbi:MAG TPA: hypothetical protein VGO47_08485 [Chlamydiales bacterium]|nr:hypothetical protein [Chlamydiales bacterium]